MYIGPQIVHMLGNLILGWWRRSNKHAICFKQVKKEWRQVNEKFFELKKGIYRDCDTSTQCYAYHYPSLFPVFFLQSLYVPFLIQRIFHSLVAIVSLVYAHSTGISYTHQAHALT